jgi:hypothetical protein
LIPNTGKNVKVGMRTRVNDEYEGLEHAGTRVINVLYSSLGEDPGGLFIGVVRGCYRTSLTTPFTLSTQS